MRKENEVELKEIIELFAVSTIQDIKTEYETPKVNFLFKDEDLSVFKYVMDHPFNESGCWIPSIKESDIKELSKENNQEEGIPTIKVDDALLFFDDLTKLINSYITFYEKHGIHSNARSLGICILRRIWLRMSKDNFNNVEALLEKQIEIVENDFMDEERFKKEIGKLNDYDIYIGFGPNRTFDETCGKVEITIGEENKKHELPNIYCGFDKENTCYIYAVQDKDSSIRNKKIERLLYKINKDIENPSIHPNHVYSLLIFLNYIKEKGVDKVIIPKQQVLSHRYHELLGEKAKRDYGSKYLITVI